MIGDWLKKMDVWMAIPNPNYDPDIRTAARNASPARQKLVLARIFNLMSDIPTFRPVCRGEATRKGGALDPVEVCRRPASLRLPLEDVQG